ncbi:uncharacterized protein K452DRAFT_322729 [Aplosporella prunicola CBS 121167]|uniref:NACHT domain-containing protein n=1 Tax=Aplosporella prunicola CBS 121167 TaxID=1176127 RepID=A0A6A6AV98_9PEZI|nr:uncharacterized protein K452DRAFT_322729 [Aplosporella prunicola CBS 121167]KAF2135962.1 hypothetical protein K452DRAFT_322729 [Aplosporella prunicola CBS 121167]
MSNPKNYTVGWICAIQTEYTAARQFLDENHEHPEHVSPNDNNEYTLGRIGSHNVVVAVLPDGEYGTSSAASVARDMLHTFPNIRIGLMVGIGGGAPTAKRDIRLGDIVVSSPSNGKGGVYQYDYGKTIRSQEFQPTGMLNQPPSLLRGAVNGLKAHYEENGNGLSEAVEAALKKKPRLRKKYQRPNLQDDRLYKTEFVHASGSEESCADVCGNDDSSLVRRHERTEDEDNTAIHYGLIASANSLMKDAVTRDKLAGKQGVLCFEMEAAGLMNHFPCLVIRGICDYSDSHKNKVWQGYAAMTAAAYAKDILRRIRPNRIEAEQKISEILSNFGQTLEKVQATAKSTDTAVKDMGLERRRDQLYDWLCPPDPSTNYNKALEQRYEGSGKWFVQGEAYREWKTQPNSFLWLYGIPGCGKTILSSTIIEDLSKALTESQPMLYFYYSFTDTRKQSTENTVRSLICQLYQKRKDVQRVVDLLFSSHENGRKQPGLESLYSTFQNMIQQANEVWIILDALDECQTREDTQAEGLLSWLRSLVASKVANVHLLVTSRPEQDIESALETWTQPENRVPIQSDLIMDDIRAYIHARVRTYEGLSRWQSSPDVQNEVETALIENADGMFRWVTCQLESLEKCLEYPTLQRALGSLPKTLDETYARILSSIPSEYEHHTRRILQFLTFSERPLRIEEAVDAIAVNIEGGKGFDPKNRMPRPREISRYCSTLVVVVARQSPEDGDAITELQLAHFSVKEYLTSKRLDQSVAKDLEETTARASIAKQDIGWSMLRLPKDIA